MAVTTTKAIVNNANLVTWSPTTLFAAGEQGAWYDPSDLNTMFQDSAATTPVTAVEQPVGLIRDKSGRGNNASQSTSASRPVLSARYNLLTKTEQFDNAAWTKANGSISANATTAPNGTTTADLFVESLDVTNSYHTFNQTFSGSGTYTFSIYVKAKERQNVTVQVSDSTNSANGCGANFNVNTSTASTSRAGAFGSGFSNVSSTILDVGNNWYRCFLNFTTTQTSLIAELFLRNGTTPYGTANYIGDGTSGIYVWGASLTVSNDGVAIPYQRVNTSTDYDSNPNLFPYYLKFDGTDDSLATSSIDFSTTNKISAFTGIRKLSDANGVLVFELSTNTNSNNGAFYFAAPYSGANYGASMRNSSSSNTITFSTYTAPITNVVSAIVTSNAANTSASFSCQINQIYSAGTSITSFSQSGNFGNYPFYVGSRATTSAFYNGRLYSLIIRGASSTTTEIFNAENWINGKTKAY